jgi:adenylate cyclase
MPDDVDFAAEGLLDGLEGQARQERAELLAWLLDEGFTLADLQRADAPMLLPAERVISGGSRMSANDIAAATGMDVDVLTELRRAQGVPVVEDHDDAVLSASDLEGARMAKGFLDAGLGVDHLIAVARVLGQGLAQAAEVMRQTVLEAVLRPGATEVELARAYSGLVEQVAPMLGPMIEDMLRLHLRHVVETEMISAAERHAGELPGARDVAVLFADLVGFTRMGEELDPAGLQSVAARLAELAREVTEAPVRFVKTIGDAVMLVSPDPLALLEAGLALVDRAEGEGEAFPQLRVGIAHGPAVSRAGDWFGSPVNLASRITAVARPGSVLVAEAARDALGDPESIAWSYAGERHLKGIRGDVKLFRARVSAPSGR